MTSTIRSAFAHGLVALGTGLLPIGLSGQTISSHTITPEMVSKAILVADEFVASPDSIAHFTLLDTTTDTYLAFRCEKNAKSFEITREVILTSGRRFLNADSLPVLPGYLYAHVRPDGRRFLRIQGLVDSAFQTVGKASDYKFVYRFWATAGVSDVGTNGSASFGMVDIRRSLDVGKSLRFRFNLKDGSEHFEVWTNTTPALYLSFAALENRCKGFFGGKTR